MDFLVALSGTTHRFRDLFLHEIRLILSPLPFLPWFTQLFLLKSFSLTTIPPSTFVPFFKIVCYISLFSPFMLPFSLFSFFLLSSLATSLCTSRAVAAPLQMLSPTRDAEM